MKVAILTSGGIAPCLSSAVGYLIETYSRVSPETEIICYLNGYRGLLLGESIRVTEKIRSQAFRLQNLGGSPIGNSRVRLKNVKDCVARGLVKPGHSPRHVAALQLIKDGVSILHTIGGDDTNMSAGDLSAYLKANFNDYRLSVVGLPKTIDNDVFPVSQTLGCQTAAEQGALFFRNIVAEYSSTPNMLIVHEVMGRNSGWLAAKTAQIYLARNRHEFPSLVERGKTDIHGIYLPEATFDLDSEVARLSEIMAKQHCVNVFLSEGSCSDIIIEEKEKNGEEIVRDAFGHVRLDTLNPGKWFTDVIAKKIGAEKVLVQKSGYFCRSAPANEFDRKLVQNCAIKAVEFALEGKTGLSGPDSSQNDEITCIDYKRVKGGKPFDLSADWFRQILDHIGQKIIPLDRKFNPAYFSYESGEPPAGQNHKIVFGGSTRDSRLVSISTASLLAVQNSEIREISDLLQNAKKSPEEVKKVGEILFALMTSFKSISRCCQDVDFSGGADSFKALANEFFSKSLLGVKSVGFFASLGGKDVQTIPNRDVKKPLYSVVLDPVDGNSNIDANVSIGSIFGIYKNDEGQSSVLSKGADLVASGYCLYGSATIMMLTAGAGVQGFTLDSINNIFHWSHHDVKLAKDGEFYSANEAYLAEWKPKMKNFVADLRSAKKRLRYIGTFVADVHRTILCGGVFFYPGSVDKPNGKLLLSTEVNPIAFLVEQSGGLAMDENGDRILDKKVSNLTQSTSVVMGSTKIVEQYQKMASN